MAPSSKFYSGRRHETLERVTKDYHPTYRYLKLAVAIWPCGHNSHLKPDLAHLPRDVTNPRANKVTPRDK